MGIVQFKMGIAHFILNWTTPILNWKRYSGYDVSKVGDRNRGWLEGFLFDSYYTYVLLHSLDCSTLPLILTLYYWVLSKEASNTIFWVFGMTRPRIEPRFPDYWQTLYSLSHDSHFIAAEPLHHEESHLIYGSLSLPFKTKSSQLNLN